MATKRALGFDTQMSLYTLQCTDDLLPWPLSVGLLREVLLRRQPTQPALRRLRLRLGWRFGLRYIGSREGSAQDVEVEAVCWFRVGY
jgi:hypothetical protein